MASKQSKQGKQSVSFRFDPITVRRLKDHAADAGSGQTALAERYIEEGIRQDEHPLIYFREGAAGRRPALLGSRLDVAEAIETIRQNDGSVEEAASHFEIPVEQLELRRATTASTPTRWTNWLSAPGPPASASASAGAGVTRLLREAPGSTR